MLIASGIIVFQTSVSALSLSDYLPFVFKSGSDSIPYRLFVPKSYHADKKYPLAVFLNGAGENGTNNTSQITGQPAGPYCFARDVAQAICTCFVLVPQQNGSKWTWYSTLGQTLLIGSINAVKQAYSIDADRIHVTGNSMGGGGSWYCAAHNFDVFATFQPVCGVGSITTTEAAAAASKPFWVWHGLNDGTVAHSISDERVDAIRAAGGHINFTEYYNVQPMGHFSWDSAYVDPDIVYWTMTKYCGWKWPLKNDSVYNIVNVGSSKVLSGPMSGTDGPVILAASSSSDLNQQWILQEATTKGYYKLVNKSSGKVLQIPTTTTKPMANNTPVSVGAAATSETDNQLWLCWDIGDRFKLVPKLCYARDTILKCIGITGGSTTDGAAALIMNYTGTNAMRWNLVKVGSSTATVPQRGVPLTCKSSTRVKTSIVLSSAHELTAANVKVYNLFGRVINTRANSSISRHGVYIVKTQK